VSVAQAVAVVVSITAARLELQQTAAVQVVDMPSEPLELRTQAAVVAAVAEAIAVVHQPIKNTQAVTADRVS
jgi:hypothetical protein